MTSKKELKKLEIVAYSKGYLDCIDYRINELQVHKKEMRKHFDRELFDVVEV